MYSVSNLGNVKRLVGYRCSRERVLSKCVDRYGYFKVGLSKDSSTKTFTVHRLVASAFLDNREEKSQVNHIDGNKLNNSVENLEWATPQENTAHAYKLGLASNRRATEAAVRANSLPVKQVDRLSGETIATFPSAAEAARLLRIDSSGISKCCKGIIQTAGGFNWKYI